MSNCRTSKRAVHRQHSKKTRIDYYNLGVRDSNVLQLPPVPDNYPFESEHYNTLRCQSAYDRIREPFPSRSIDEVLHHTPKLQHSPQMRVTLKHLEEYLPTPKVSPAQPAWVPSKTPAYPPRLPSPSSDLRLHVE
jgi:hypothetical protein